MCSTDHFKQTHAQFASLPYSQGVQPLHGHEGSPAARTPAGAPKRLGAQCGGGGGGGGGGGTRSCSANASSRCAPSAVGGGDAPSSVASRLYVGRRSVNAGGMAAAGLAMRAAASLASSPCAAHERICMQILFSMNGWQPTRGRVRDGLLVLRPALEEVAACHEQQGRKRACIACYYGTCSAPIRAAISSMLQKQWRAVTDKRGSAGRWAVWEALSSTFCNLGAPSN